MSLPTTTITGKIYTPEGVVASEGTIRCALSTPGRVDDEFVIASEVVAGFSLFAIQATGDVEAGMTLVPNDAITPAGTYYRVAFSVTAPVRSSWEEIWQVASTPDPVAIGDITRLNVAPGLSVVSSPGLDAYFGDGSDGDLTVGGGGLTLVRDSFYHDLTLNGICTTNGFRLFVSGTLTINNGGSVRWNGGNGVTSGGVVGGSASGSLTAANVGGSSAGGSGTTGSVSNGSSGGTTTAVNGMGGAGGSGGAGGDGFGGFTGGAGGASGTSTYHPFKALSIVLVRLAGTLIQGGSGGRGGAGGAGDGSLAQGGGGGGGGAGGGVVPIFARTITIAAGGLIQANGGNGGGGGTGALNGGDGAGGGGGAAGGGGGFVFMVYRYLSNAGTITASGGSGGLAGGAVGGGFAGNPGGPGASGRVVKINLQTGVVS